MGGDLLDWYFFLSSRVQIISSMLNHSFNSRRESGILKAPLYPVFYTLIVSSIEDQVDLSYLTLLSIFQAFIYTQTIAGMLQKVFGL